MTLSVFLDINPYAPEKDRIRTVSQRTKPNSRTAFIGEQPNPWNLLQLQDAMSRHRRNVNRVSVQMRVSPRQTIVVESCGASANAHRAKNDAQNRSHWFPAPRDRYANCPVDGTSAHRSGKGWSTPARRCVTSARVKQSANSRTPDE